MGHRWDRYWSAFDITMVLGSALIFDILFLYSILVIVLGQMGQDCEDNMDNRNLMKLQLFSDEFKYSHTDLIEDSLASNLIAQMLTKDPVLSV